MNRLILLTAAATSQNLEFDPTCYKAPLVAGDPLLSTDVFRDDLNFIKKLPDPRGYKAAYVASCVNKGKLVG